MTEPSLKEKAARLARFRSCPVGSVASLYPHQINGGWSAFADDIEAVLADREALKARLEEAEGAMKYIKGLKPEPIGDSGFQTGPAALLQAAQRRARAFLTPKEPEQRPAALSPETDQ